MSSQSKLRCMPSGLVQRRVGRGAEARARGSRPPPARSRGASRGRRAGARSAPGPGRAGAGPRRRRGGAARPRAARVPARRGPRPPGRAPARTSSKASPRSSTAIRSTPEMPSIIAVMRLLDDREAVAALEALDHPELPERAASVEALGEDPAREALQLAPVAGLGERRVPHVEVDLEVVVVDPDRMALDGHVGEALAVARDQVRAARRRRRGCARCRSPPSGVRSDPLRSTIVAATCWGAVGPSRSRKVASWALRRS